MSNPTDWLAGRDDPHGTERKQLEQIREGIIGEQPMMPEVPSGVVTLFRGVYVDNHWDQTAVVRELTGADEEAIARMMGGSTPAIYINAVLTHGVEMLGPHSLEKANLADRTALLDNLLVGEKEILFLNVLRVTYGDRRTVGIRCPQCENVNDVSFALSEITIKDMDDPFASTYEFTCRSGDNICYRLVTGADQAEAQRRPNATQPEMNTILLSRVITTVNGRPLADPLHFARDLGALDRRHFLEELTEKQPGPTFEEVKLPCATCGAESLFTPGWADLL